MVPFVDAARQLVYGLRVREGRFEHRDRWLEWRHHGLGMLQAELSETLRIHVWHPILVSPDMTWPRCVHDHRFDLTSAVIVGEVIDVPCEVTVGDHMVLGTERTPVDVYEIEHAKTQDLMVPSTATITRKLSSGTVLKYPDVPQGAGRNYHIKRRNFHTTRLNADAGVAVTVIHRDNFDAGLARVLCAPDKDVMAVSGIIRDDSPEHQALIASVLKEAGLALAMWEAAHRGPS